MNMTESLNANLCGFRVTELKAEAPGWRKGFCPDRAKRLTIYHLDSRTEFDCRLLYCSGKAFMKMDSPMQLHFKEHGQDITVAWVLRKVEGPAGSPALKEELLRQLLNTTLSSG